MTRSTLALLALSTSLVFAGSALGQSGQPKLPRIEGLSAYALQSVEVPAGIPETAEVKVAINGRTETLLLTRTSLRSAKARLLLDRGNGTLEEAPLPPHRTYRGIVASTGTLVSASIIDGRISAMIDMPGDTVFVQPVADFPELRGRTGHVVYSHSQVVPIGDHRCGNDEVKLENPDWMHNLPVDPAVSGTVTAPEGGVAGTSPFITEIAFDADFEFFQLNASNAVNVVNDIENVMNNVSTVYDRDVNIAYELTTFVVRTTAADPYTTTIMNDLLCEFRTKWNTSPENEIQRDVAQLFTGKQVTGNVIGLAWLGVLCNQTGTDCTATGNLAYSCVESRFTGIADFRTSLSAHEIGHNWQAQHCDAVNPCNIMCSVINSCQGTTGANLKFAASEQAQITAFRNTVGCDVALPPPISLPFGDSFDASATINASNWIYSKGAAVSTAAVNEPSPTRSLNLDAIGNLAYGDDEIRSNYMLLAGLPTVIVQYSVQQIGVEAGKQLVVEYLNTSLDWVALNTVTSTGVPTTTFTSYQHTLPANAKHNKFRLRFRTLVDAQDDDWFIDDVRVVTVVVPNNDECASATTVSEGAFAFNTTNATDSAGTIPASCNDGAGTIVKNDIWYLYNPTCDGYATATTCGAASFDTRITVYSLACPTSGVIIACSDNAAGCALGTSQATFPVFAGGAYYIRVGGGAGGGTGTLTLSCAAQQPCPADLNADGVVDGTDLAGVLNAWGTPNADIDSDGNTGGSDLAIILNAWGACQ
jgi:Metallo-peptidase family M12